MSKIQFSILLLSVFAFQAIGHYYLTNEINDEINNIFLALKTLDGGLSGSNDMQFPSGSDVAVDGVDRVVMTDGLHSDEVRFDAIDKSLVLLSKKIAEINDYMNVQGPGGQSLVSETLLDESKILELYSKASTLIDDLPVDDGSDEYWVMKDNVISIILKLPVSQRSDLYEKLHASR